MIMLRSALLLAGLLNLQVLAFHQVVFPRKLHVQHKRDTQSNYADVVQYELQLNGKTLILHLEKTEDLVSDSYSETHYLPNGAPITIISDNKDHCYYQGHVKDDNDSLVSVSVCSGISGVILTQGLRILIDPLKNTDHEEHVVYLDQEETPRVCGVTNNIWTEDELLKSQTINDSEKQELFKSQKYIQLYIVADKSMFTKYNSTEAVKKKIFEIVNYVNMVYKSINTFVALIGFEIWDANNQIEVHTSAPITLDRFSTWIKNNLLPRKLHDNAQLLTNTDFEGPTVGMAYVGTMCSDLSAGIIQDHSKISTSVGATLAHEMGHNLGMNHDDSSCGCSATSCIMSPTITYTTPSLFSACSLQYFNQFILSKLPKCLLDKPQPNDIQASPVCGNKFTEIGEDCDCGTKEECTNECCDAATCKLKPDAKCAEGECCVNCQVVKAGVVCRPSKDDCDLPDMCDGNSPVCQTDHFQVNGFPCSNGKGYCYNGKCPNMLSQCVTLWGESAGVCGDTFFRTNMNGNIYGYCQKYDNKYIPCAQKDIKCGVLYCYGGSEWPSVYAPFVNTTSWRAVLAPEGMVQNGTKCGESLVCKSGVCMTIDSAYGSSGCSAKCPAHSVCDHNLQCVCEVGWILPNCTSAEVPVQD